MQPNTPRPKRDSEDVIRAAAQGLLPAVMGWLKRNGEDDTESERKEVVDQLCHALKWCDHDGYAIAKELDDDGWAPDAALVEVLDDYPIHRNRAHDSLVAAWLPTSGLTAPAVGSWWTCPRESKHPGHVLSNDHKHGTATLCIPALGHTPNPGLRGGTFGYVIPWEELTPHPLPGGAL